MKIFEFFIGDHNTYSVEHRLFNSLTLLNGLMNFGNALSLDFQEYKKIILLNAGIGIFFLLLYIISRAKHQYRRLYWPFMLSMLVFLMVNTILNAGSLGGTQYYFITAVVIGVVLAQKNSQVILCTSLFIIGVLILYYLESYTPYIVPYKNSSDRIQDIFGNFIFVQLLTAVIVLVMSRTLNKERGKSDKLLLNILPVSIANELKVEEKVKPLHYKQATVLFTDFVGFTQIAEKLTPDELVLELDQCFRAFDEIMQRYSMEKIKTIGDAYMAAGGIPQENTSNPVDAVLSALEIANFMEELRKQKSQQGKDFWELRIGLHTGPLVAGVIGKRKFAYDIWGDTVNLASRMESSGEKNSVNISSYTYELVKDFFECESRGQIKAKNKGLVEMYFVKGIRQELMDPHDSTTPNILFKERYNRLKKP